MNWYTGKQGKPDVTRVLRKLGLKSCLESRTKGAPRRTQRYVDVTTAELLARAMGMEAIDAHVDPWKD